MYNAIFENKYKHLPLHHNVSSRQTFDEWQARVPWSQALQLHWHWGDLASATNPWSHWGHVWLRQSLTPPRVHTHDEQLCWLWNMVPTEYLIGPSKQGQRDGITHCLPSQDWEGEQAQLSMFNCSCGTLEHGRQCVNSGGGLVWEILGISVTVTGW